MNKDFLLNCFNNPKEINILDIYSCTIRYSRDYSLGGFYKIESDSNIYIGKSKDFMGRLKQHTFKSSNKTRIDKDLKINLEYYKYYLILDYKSQSINFSNRKLETILEQTFIKLANSSNKNILNDRVYGHISII